jgi:hypothetical protein
LHFIYPYLIDRALPVIHYGCMRPGRAPAVPPVRMASNAVENPVSIRAVPQWSKARRAAVSRSNSAFHADIVIASDVRAVGINAPPALRALKGIALLY